MGSSREYIHDGDNLLAEVNSAGQVVSQYTNYPGVDAPHSVTYNGQAYYFAIEAPGNVTGLVTPEGAVAASWGYDPWGVPHTRSGADSLPMPLRFAAREYDAETGLYYNRARYYDPATGRFISEDPIGLEGGFNLYTYAGNNPINKTDPSGLFELVCHWGVSTTGSPGNYVSERYLIDCREIPGGGFPARPSGFQNAVNAIAGFGDGASGGVTYLIRAAVGGNENVDFQSPWYKGAQGAGTLAAFIIGSRGAELTMGKNFRLAPYGNRTGHHTGQFPHYHRRQFDASGNIPQVGSKNWHRPWDPPQAGRGFWSRF